MTRTRLLGATALCVALTATACSGSNAPIAAKQPAPIAATTSVANQDAEVRLGSTTTTPPVARQDVEIRVRVAVAGAGSTDEAPQTGTLQIPTDLSDTTPAVVLLHGAGGPTRHSLAPMADAVVAMGIPVLNASWLADHKRAGESVADAVCAVAYAYKNASSWGADPDRIIVMGHSGGGQVGMLAGLAPEAFPECAMASEAHVWAYIGLAGDPASAAPGGNLRRFLVSDPELLKRMDSYNHIGGNPGLIVRFVHGTSDGTVPIELTGAFHDSLIKAGYDSELIPVNGAGHADPANPTRDAGVAALDQLAILVESVQP